MLKIVLFIISLLVLLSSCSENKENPYVILISLDGFRYDYPDSVETPALDKMSREGVRAESLRPIFPTKTFPNHYAIATGLYAENHGIVANKFYDPEMKGYYTMADSSKVRDGKWYGGEPLWVTARKNGQIAASYFWVGSETEIEGIRPDYYYLYDHSRPNSAIVDKAIDWLALPENKRPRFITLYFHDTDDTGHHYGPLSPENRQSIKILDGVIGTLRAKIDSLGMKEQVDIILVSDHGMRNVPGNQLIQIETLDFPDSVIVISEGLYIDIKMENKSLIAPLVSQLNKKADHFTVYRKEDFPERWHYKNTARTGDILLLANLGWKFLDKKQYEWHHRTKNRGEHGFDNNDTLMQGIFYAVGPHIKTGTEIPPVRNIDIFPLVSHILKWKNLPQFDGSYDSIKVVLKEEK